MQTHNRSKNVSKARKKPMKKLKNPDFCPECGGRIFYKTIIDANIYSMHMEGECYGCGLTVA